MGKLEQLELAAKFLEEAKGHIGKEDPIQASEKLFKVAEEALKSLSARYASEISDEATKRERWTTNLLFKAAETIAKQLGEDVRRYWNAAWTLHVEGFHEGKLDASYVARNVEDIEELLRLAEREQT